MIVLEGQQRGLEVWDGEAYLEEATWSADRRAGYAGMTARFERSAKDAGRAATQPKDMRSR